MYESIEYSTLEEFKGKTLLIDVRSPQEYMEDTISGAINIPILDDEERKIIGTLYKSDVEEAKKVGVEIGSKKLPIIFNKILEYEKQYDKIVIFCAKGGMRSSVLTSMLTALGLKVKKLNGGYKAYRACVTQSIPKINECIKFIVLHGNTGVGKTKILKELRETNYQVLDLEGAANHRGSLLGNVGLGEGFTQKKFETNIYSVLKDFKTEYVFVEAESKRIGRVFIPECIHNKMKEGIHIFVDAPIDFRVNLIAEEYTQDEKATEEILDCLERLSKYISKSNIDKYKELVQKGDFKAVTEELMIKYYDPMYMHSADKYEYKLKIKVENIKCAVDNILCWYKEFL